MVVLIVHNANFQEETCQQNKNMMNIQNKHQEEYLLIVEIVNNKITIT
jgi:hypothetical protein